MLITYASEKRWSLRGKTSMEKRRIRRKEKKTSPPEKKSKRHVYSPIIPDEGENKYLTKAGRVNLR